MIDVANLNRTFPKYPCSMRDKGWSYGVWYCGTSWTKVKLYGQYPPTFVKRALALFPGAKHVLHAPSGSLEDMPDGHITLDYHQTEVVRPAVRGDCATLPFRDNAFDLVLADPPYSKEDAKVYNCTPFPQTKFLSECHRVLKPDAYVGFLAGHYPSYRRKMFKLEGLFAVVTGFQRMTRMFSVFRVLKEECDDPTVQ